jgi:hypothetical protein
LCGLFGRFDFSRAQRLFEQVSRSGGDSAQFAIVLCKSLSLSDCEIMNATDFSTNGSIFSILMSPVHETKPLIQLLNPNLCNGHQTAEDTFQAWRETASLSAGFLLDLSQSGSHPTSSPVPLNPSTQRPVLRSLPTDLSSCTSIPDMIPLIFRMYSIDSLLYKNVNHFLRCFPIRIISKFMKELGGILRYIYLLQSSIAQYSHIQLLSSNLTVYRGIQQHGRLLMPLYESMIGEVIVWAGFTSTSPDQDLVLSRFIKDDDSLLFSISLHPGDVAVGISDYSDYPEESEILIAASSGFMVEEVEWIEIRGTKIGQVRLSYCISWYDFNIDDRPAPILV